MAIRPGQREPMPTPLHTGAPRAACQAAGSFARAVLRAGRLAHWPQAMLIGWLAALPWPSASAAETAQRGPDVTLIEGEERTIYEYRQNGQLRLVKIVPRNGRPYYLAPLDPSKGFGDFDKAEFVVPQWEIIRF